MATIVVGTDGRPGSEEAVRFAAREASLRGASLRIVHAWPEPPTVSAGLIGTPRDVNPEPTRQHADQVVDAAAAVAGAIAPDVAIEHDAMAGPPAMVIVDATAGADLLVVGSRGRGDLASLVFGSTSHHCLRHASCPVVVVRHAARDGARDVVVGIEGVAADDALLTFATAEAARRGGSLRVVHSWHVPVAVAMGPMAVAAPLDPEPARKAAIATVEAAVAAAGPGAVGDAPEGDPVAALVRAAEGAALLVVGGRRRGDLAAIVLGSVGHGCLAEAGCPVAFL